MKILYGVPGEGMGHATRSKVIIDFLLQQKHEVQVVSSARAYTFLNNHFPGRVHEIKGFHFAYKNSEVSKSGTFWLNLKTGPANFIHNFSKYLKLDKQFHPDLVISDFESFAYYYAKLNRIKIISIDNMQIMDRCKLTIPIPSEEQSNFRLAKGIVQAKVPNCAHYFISTFFDAPITKKNTTLVPPIVRDAIIAAKPVKGNHIIVYQTSGTLATIKKAFHALPNEQFIVYGMNRDEKDRNIQFKLFSESGFVNDLASSKAVIANGGFSFISEAVYLQKPVYSFPIKNQFEQYMNAAYIEQCGFGRHFTSPDADSLKAFLYDLPFFEKQLQQHKQKGNEVLFAALKKLLK